MPEQRKHAAQIEAPAQPDDAKPPTYSASASDEVNPGDSIPVERDDARNAVLLRADDHEIRPRRAGAWIFGRMPA